MHLKTTLWCGIAIYAAALLFFQSYAMTASTFAYTFVARNITGPGTLYSERWSRDFFYTAAIPFLWLVPLSMAFMLGAIFSKDRRALHIACVVVIWMAFMVFFSLACFDYAHANQPTLSNAHNPANSDRWCCIYFNITGSGCPNVAPCNPGVGPAELEVNHVFKYKFWFTLVFLILLIFDFVLMITWVPDAVDSKRRGTAATAAVPLLDEESGPPPLPSAPPEKMERRITMVASKLKSPFRK